MRLGGLSLPGVHGDRRRNREALDGIPKEIPSVLEGASDGKSKSRFKDLLESRRPVSASGVSRWSAATEEDQKAILPPWFTGKPQAAQEQASTLTLSPSQPLGMFSLSGMRPASGSCLHRPLSRCSSESRVSAVSAHCAKAFLDSQRLHLGANSSPRVVEWSRPLRHSIPEARITMQLVATERRGREVDSTCSKCNVEVKIHCPCVEKPLAVCRGSFWPRDKQVQIHWLGRLPMCPGFEPEDTRWRWLDLDSCHDDIESQSQTPPTEVVERNMSQTCTRRTLPEVALGLVAGIAQLFGMITVSLEAEDKGSGRLIDYYLRHGFTLTGQKDGKDPTMQAPIALISQLAPATWCRMAMSPVLDIWAWLGCHIKTHWLVKENREWSWNSSWPSSSKVTASFKPYCDNLQRCNMINVEASLYRGQVELAFIKCALRPRQKSLRIMWLGCSRSRAVHDSVRGEKAFEVALADSGCAHKVTAAVALLGTACAVARWLETETVELLAFDSGSGALQRYFSSLGFAEMVGDPTPMKASCKALALRCCPADWRGHLPPDSEVAIMARIISTEEDAPAMAA